MFYAAGAVLKKMSSASLYLLEALWPLVSLRDFFALGGDNVEYCTKPIIIAILETENRTIVFAVGGYE